MSFNLKAILDHFANSAPKANFVVFIMLSGLNLILNFFPNYIPSLGDDVIWTIEILNIITGLALLGYVLWEIFTYIKEKALPKYLRAFQRHSQKRKMMKALFDLSINELTCVSMAAHFREKSFLSEKSDDFIKSLEKKGIIKQSFASKLSEITPQSWYSRHYEETPEFEFTDLAWKIIVEREEFTLSDPEGLRKAIMEGKRDDELAAFLPAKHPAIRS